MVAPIEEAVISPFDPAAAAQWRQLKAGFWSENELVKGATRELIDASFKKVG